MFAENIFETIQLKRFENRLIICNYLNRLHRLESLISTTEIQIKMASHPYMNLKIPTALKCTCVGRSSVHFAGINISDWTDYKIPLQREIGPMLF